MAGAKAKLERGNPVLPPPPIPKKVLESNVKSAPDVGGKVGEVVEEKAKPKVLGEGKVIGTITISIYDDRPYEAKFEGKIAGPEMNIAVLALRKQYKLWKRGLIEKEGGK